MKKYAFIFGFLLSSTFLLAQIKEKKLDSLWNDLNVEKDPLVKSEKLLSYSQILSSISSDNAIKFSDSLIAFYQSENFSIALGRAVSMKSWFYNHQAKYAEAIELGYEALAILEKENDSLGIAQTYNRIGVTNIYFKRFKSAETFLNKAFKAFGQLRDTARMDMILNNLGVLYSEQNQQLKSIDYYKKSLSLRLKMGDFFWVAYSYSNIAESYLEANELDSAVKYIELAIATFQEKTRSRAVPALAESVACKIYFTVKDYEKARYWGEKALEQAKRQNHTEVIVLATGQLASIYAALGNFEKAYNTGLAFQEMQAKQDSSNSAAAVAEVEARYKTAEKEVEISRLQAANSKAESAAQKSWIIALVLILFIATLFFTSLVIFQRRLQTQRFKQANLHAQLSEVKMMALRAQMNPHFIFNCINTAQNFVLSSEKAEAYEYLSKFAKLLRLVLENSSKTLVPLEDELKQLKLYMELEAVRFGEKFTYKIQVDETLENGVYQIPGMLVQPLVENALLHGIMNRDDTKGKLILLFEKRADTIYCEIRDNGVGRQRASQIKAEKTQHYQSAAIPNITERLSLLQKATSSEVQLTIVDLMENGNPVGTKAQLYIPYS